MELLFRQDINNFDRYRSQVLNLLANRLLTLIAQFAPARTGAYIRSWRVLARGPETITVGSTADPRLFVMLEFTGAQPHTIEPGGQSLRFQLRTGEIIFAKIVSHPGMKARPHLRPAMRMLASEAEGIAYAAMEGNFKFLKGHASRAARSAGYRKEIPPRQTARNVKDTTANIGRGNKGNISAQLTSRFTGRKRIRRGGLVRVGTSEKRFKQAGKIPKIGGSGEAATR